MVYSNSSSKSSIRVQNKASIEAGVICSAGGVKGTRRASFLPKPLTDCPIINDPLADRIAPPIGNCDFKRFRVRKGNHTLFPGTYCKGMKITGTAKVKLMPGIYVINGAKLEVTNNAVFEGENVGFYLAGDKAKIVFTKQTTINLTAPKKGLMAGLLIFEDRNAARIENHQITSDNARMLLGTIYLPNGTLKIDSEAPVADKAAYTAIIARSIKLFEGPTLHLNSDHAATDVPVPKGLGASRCIWQSKLWQNLHLVIITRIKIWLSNRIFVVNEFCPIVSWAPNSFHHCKCVRLRAAAPRFCVTIKEGCYSGVVNTMGNAKLISGFISDKGGL